MDHKGSRKLSPHHIRLLLEGAEPYLNIQEPIFYIILEKADYNAFAANPGPIHVPTRTFAYGNYDTVVPHLREHHHCESFRDEDRGKVVYALVATTLNGGRVVEHVLTLKPPTN